MMNQIIAYQSLIWPYTFPIKICLVKKSQVSKYLSAVAYLLNVVIFSHNDCLIMFSGRILATSLRSSQLPHPPFSTYLFHVTNKKQRGPCRGKKRKKKKETWATFRPLADLSSLTSGEQLTFLSGWFRAGLSASLKSIFASFPSGWSSRAAASLSLSLSLLFSFFHRFHLVTEEYGQRRRTRNGPCCRNGIGLINVGGPRIWLNYVASNSNRRIRFSKVARRSLELDQLSKSSRRPRERARIFEGKVR